MQSFTPKKPPYGQGTQAQANPFARALAETEKSSTDADASSQPDLLSQAFSQSGANLNSTFDNNVYPDQAALLEEQQRKARLEQMRRQRHAEINPVSSNELFSAREAQVKKEIDQLRQELALLAKDVAAFDKEVELTLQTTITHPGQTGSYYLNFFQKLRQFIMLLRQKIQSARTWATTFYGKSAKKRSKQPGLTIGGQQFQQTTTIQDMMHHERSVTYGGA